MHAKCEDLLMKLTLNQIVCAFIQTISHMKVSCLWVIAIKKSIFLAFDVGQENTEVLDDALNLVVYLPIRMTKA